MVSVLEVKAHVLDAFSGDPFELEFAEPSLTFPSRLLAKRNPAQG